jgi:hypothetical protein
VKNDELFRDGLGRPPADEPAATDSGHRRRWSLATPLRAVILIVALWTAGLVLYGILQVFVCDFRAVVFKGMSHRAVWLCR